MVNQTVQQQVIEEAQETFGGDVIVYVGQDSAGDHLVRINGREVLYTIPNDWL